MQALKKRKKGKILVTTMLKSENWPQENIIYNSEAAAEWKRGSGGAKVFLIQMLVFASAAEKAPSQTKS